MEGIAISVGVWGLNFIFYKAMVGGSDVAFP
jgi:hypothetical protein